MGRVILPLLASTPLLNGATRVQSVMCYVLILGHSYTSSLWQHVDSTHPLLGCLGTPVYSYLVKGVGVTLLGRKIMVKIYNFFLCVEIGMWYCFGFYYIYFLVKSSLKVTSKFGWTAFVHVEFNLFIHFNSSSIKIWRQKMYVSGFFNLIFFFFLRVMEDKYRKVHISILNISH